MKRNSSIFIMMGVIVFISGQLQSMDSVQKNGKNFKINIHQEIKNLKKKIDQEIEYDYDQAYFSKLNKSFKKLVEFISLLNAISAKEKKMKKPVLAIDDFIAIALALDAMANFISSVNSRFKTLKMGENSEQFINEQNNKFSELKTNLYKIYEVREEIDNKISILYYAWLPAEDEPEFYYSDPRIDPLAGIGPSVGSIEKGRIGKQGLEAPMSGKEAEERLSEIRENKKMREAILGVGEEPSFMKGLAMQAAAILAVVMIEQLVGQAEVGAMKNEIEKAVSAAIRKGDTVLEAAKSAVVIVVQKIKAAGAGLSKAIAEVKEASKPRLTRGEVKEIIEEELREGAMSAETEAAVAEAVAGVAVSAVSVEAAEAVVAEALALIKAVKVVAAMAVTVTALGKAKLIKEMYDTAEILVRKVGANTLDSLKFRAERLGFGEVLGVINQQVEKAKEAMQEISDSAEPGGVVDKIEGIIGTVRESVKAVVDKVSGPRGFFDEPLEE